MRSTVVAATLALSLAGCAGNASSREGQTASKCAPQVRLDGVIYHDAGYTDQEGTAFGTVDEADCDDVGPNAKGSVFPDDPKQVAVWSFDGYAPEEVVGVRFDQDTFGVFVAEPVPRHRVDRIVNELSKSE